MIAFTDVEDLGGIATKGEQLPLGIQRPSLSAMTFPKQCPDFCSMKATAYLVLPWGQQALSAVPPAASAQMV